MTTHPEQPSGAPVTGTSHSDVHLKKVSKNFLYLLKGRGGSAVFGLLATAIAARALPTAEFGLVVMIHTYLLTLRGLLNLKPFEAIIRYGVKAQEQRQESHIRQLLRITLTLDIALAALGTIIAVGLPTLLAPVFAWDKQITFLATVYSLLMVFSATGTAEGVLRLFNRFDLLGIRQSIGPLVQLIATVAAWQLDGGFIWFLAAWGLGWFTENILMMLFGYREYCRSLGGNLLASPVWLENRNVFPGLWHFLHVVYWQSNLDMIPKKFAVLAVGALLDPAAAGMYRIAQQFSKVLTIPALLVRQVLFPDLARLWHRKDKRFAQLVRRVLWIGLSVGAAVALLSFWLGAPLIDLIVGKEYLNAQSVLFWLMLAAGMDLSVAGLRAAGYAMGLAGLLLRIYLASLVLYGVLFIWLGQVLGLVGTGVAAACWSLFNLILIGLAARRQLPAEG